MCEIADLEHIGAISSLLTTLGSGIGASLLMCHMFTALTVWRDCTFLHFCS